MIRSLTLILLISLIILTNAYAIDISYVISLQKTNDKLSLISIELADGPGQDYIDQQEYGYKANILSFKEEILFTVNFTIEKDIIERRDTNATEYEQSEEIADLTFPYYNNAKKIEIYDETGELKLEIDLSSYARCNENEFCDFNENKGVCPEDCEKEAAIIPVEEAPKEIIEEKVATEEKTNLETLEEKGINRNLLIVIGILFLIFIIILISARKKKEENKN